jgi:glycosyltransferase involved in cell wall biosynthesis
MKTILFVSGGMNSGSEHCLFRLINTLDPLEFRVVVLTKYDDYNNLHGIQCHAYFSEESYLITRNFITKVKYRLFNNHGHHPSATLFSTILERHSPDLIYINFLTLPDHYSYFFNRPSSYILHGHSLHHYLYAFDFKTIESRIKNALCIVSSSGIQAETFRLICANPESHIVYPPVLLSNLIPRVNSRDNLRRQLGINDNTFVWMMSSTYFNYNKDPLRFIQIGQKIMEASGKDIFLLWIGSDENSTAAIMAKEYARTHGIEDKIFFTGQCSHALYVDYLDAADACLLISFEESFSIVTAEAIAMGKPVLAFDCGGVSEIINADNGYLVEAYNVENFVSKAKELMLNYADFSPEMMRKSVQKFDISFQSTPWKEILKNYIKM